jgi:hypothetical protein
VKPHKHVDFIKAWADGFEIEYKLIGENIWLPIYPDWNWNNPVAKYRIKPEPKPDFFCIEYIYTDENGDWMSTDTVPGNLKLTFDGETGKLKSAEVLNGR